MPSSERSTAPGRQSDSPKPFFPEIVAQVEALSTLRHRVTTGLGQHREAEVDAHRASVLQPGERLALDDARVEARPRRPDLEKWPSTCTASDCPLGRTTADATNTNTSSAWPCDLRPIRRVNRVVTSLEPDTAHERCTEVIRVERNADSQKHVLVVKADPGREPEPPISPSIPDGAGVEKER